MSESGPQLVDKDAQEHKPPVCPKCGQEIVHIQEAGMTTANGFIIHMSYCEHDECRALFGVTVIGESVKRRSGIVGGTFVPH